MQKAVRITSHEEALAERLEYWLSRSPEERLSEVERLRREYLAIQRGSQSDAIPEGLCRTLRLVEREWD